MSKISPKQKYETLQEWLQWFNVKYGRTRKAKAASSEVTEDKSFRVDIKGMKRR